MTAATWPKSQGILGLGAGNRLRFVPEVYPVEQIALDGWRRQPDGAWTAAYSAARCVRLAQEFPGVLVEQALAEFLVREQQSQAPAGIGLRRRDDAIDRLYPWQQAAAQWLASRRSGILAMAPGLGKTATALAALRMAGVRTVLVVCPLTLRDVWAREAAMWWPEAVVHQAYCPSTTDASAPRIFVLGYERFRLAQRGAEIGAVEALIFDESVLLKSRRAQRTRAAAEARRAAGICWMLSGSPTTRFYDDLWAQLNALEPQEYRAYWRFVDRYCVKRTSVWGTDVVANRPGAADALRRDLANVFFQYNYSDLAREHPEHTIPEWVVESRAVPMPAAWWTAYRQMQDTFMADLPDDGGRVLAQNALVKALRLVQIASNPGLVEGVPWQPGGKVAAAVELFEELPQPTIFWTAFVQTAQVLSAALSATLRVPVPVLSGETPPDERTRVVEAFQAGDLPALVAHPAVGKFGLTLTTGKAAVYVERGYSGDDYFQSLFRIRRIGTTEPPRIVHLISTGPQGQRTVDHVVDRVLDYRRDQAEVLTSAVVREVLGGRRLGMARRGKAGQG